MASEISITAELGCNKGYISISRSASIQPDMSGSAFTNQVQLIGTTEEQIVITADITVPGYAYFRNLDTESVQIGVKPAGTFYPLIELLAGEVAVLRLANVAVYAKSLGSGAVNLEVCVLEA